MPRTGRADHARAGTIAPIPENAIFAPPFRKKNMLIIPVKEGEPIDKALKKFKKKFERTGTMRSLRKRQAFIKPSVELRKERLRAVYKQVTYGGEQ